MENNKIITFIGFALRARKIKCGVNAVSTVKGKIDVMIICHSASQNTFDESVKLAKAHNSILLVSKDYKIEDIVHKENCKLIAILDKDLATAILKFKDSHFEDYLEGVK